MLPRKGIATGNWRPDWSTCLAQLHEMLPRKGIATQAYGLGIGYFVCMKRLYAIAYDIPDDTRRVKLANLLKGYGERVQLSVFECYLDERLLRDLRARAGRLLDLSQDALRIYPVDGEVLVMGAGRVVEQEAFALA